MEGPCNQTEGTQLQILQMLLRRRGAEVLELPSVRTVALDAADESPLREAFDQNGPLISGLVFTSPTGVEIFL